ncbi:MAG: ribose-5-phosphate isomerase RpiA [Acidobacteriota bacterium]|nr:ribose-5-phosphate isomerase RpiA [Acidobacteriota bacterium]MDE3171320.1 ribose-5-phosphate isomerase RpiA [Acidobacteriota bacterium]
MNAGEQNKWKKAAADAAAALVEDGMVLGLGTGSTADLFIEALGRRLAADGLRITGIPTSRRTEELARASGIPLSSFAEHAQIDLTVDGADEIERGTICLIKGHGGALLREKIVAAASQRMVVIADESKLVDRLGSLVAVPVEVVRFGWQATARRLEKIGGNPSLRLGKDNTPYITDGGNFIMDCAFGPIGEPKEVAHRLDHVVGAVEHGLFLGYASEAIVGGRSGLKTYRRTGS